jgi:hypothetical protein
MSNLDDAEITSRIKKWEAEHPDSDWMWSDIPLHPAVAVHLVVEGVIEVKQVARGRWPNLYRLIKE